MLLFLENFISQNKRVFSYDKKIMFLKSKYEYKNLFTSNMSLVSERIFIPPLCPMCCDAYTILFISFLVLLYINIYERVF